jgi:hypothetical protein
MTRHIPQEVILVLDTRVSARAVVLPTRISPATGGREDDSCERRYQCRPTDRLYL